MVAGSERRRGTTDRADRQRRRRASPVPRLSDAEPELQEVPTLLMAS